MTARTGKRGCAAWRARSARRNARPSASTLRKSKDKKPDFVGKQQFYPARFDIDISVCMSCQICVEVCPFEAIKMDTEFELGNAGPVRRIAAGPRRTGQVERVLPHDPSHGGESEVDARLAEEKAKAEAKAKAAAAASPKPAAASRHIHGSEPAPAAPTPGSHCAARGRDSCFLQG